MKKLALALVIFISPFICSGNEGLGINPPKISQNVADDRDEKPQWIFYSVIGMSFMGVYYMLKKVVLNIGGDSGM
jgi:hypothetical protein